MPIFDQGYQHWEGKLSGHTWRWLAITRHGVRVQMKNRLVRLLLLFAWLPALVLVGAVAIWGLVEQKSEGALAVAAFLLPPELLLEPKAFRPAFWTLAYSNFFAFEMFYIMLLVVVAGPGLISRDLRFNALPLYFSRSLTRLDYFLGKLGVIGTLVGAIAVVPAVIAYLIGICFSFDLSVVKDTFHVLLASVAYGLIVTLSVGTLILALSSLSRRSMYIGITWAGIWIVSSLVGVTLSAWHRESSRQTVYLAQIDRWLAEHPPPPEVPTHNGHPTGFARPAGATPEQVERINQWNQQWQQASQAAMTASYAGNRDILRKDWSPLCSYSSNLERMADALLDTDSAWVLIGKAQVKMQAAGGPRRGGPRGYALESDERQLANEKVFQYPWIWSAGVLAALMGLSVWILTRRVKSLDRLK